MDDEVRTIGYVPPKILRGKMLAYHLPGMGYSLLTLKKNWGCLNEGYCFEADILDSVNGRRRCNGEKLRLKLSPLEGMKLRYTEDKVTGILTVTLDEGITPEILDEGNVEIPRGNNGASIAIFLMSQENLLYKP